MRTEEVKRKLCFRSRPAGQNSRGCRSRPYPQEDGRQRAEGQGTTVSVMLPRANAAGITLTRDR